MTNDEILDAFFGRLRADPQLAMLPIVLEPQRRFARDPAGLVATLDALAAHWAAVRTAPVELTS